MGESGKGDAEIEMPELPEEPSGRGHGWTASVVVSCAAVLVTAMIGVLGVVNNRMNESYEEEKNERDFRLSCVTSAATIATMAFSLSDAFAGMNDEEKINRVNIIIASFPPDTASRFLATLAPRIGGNPAVIRAFQVAQDNATAQIEQDKRLTCPTAPALISLAVATSGGGGDGGAAPRERPQALFRPPAAVAAPNPAAPNPAPGAAGEAAPVAPATAPPAAVASAPPPPPPPPVAAAAPDALRLATYYQITSAADRPLADQVAHDVGLPGVGLPGSATPAAASYPSAGVQLVRTAPLPVTQVRYYQADQDEAAAALGERIVAAGRARGLQLSVRTLYIGDRFPNLPSGRIEVWFQPLQAAHHG